MGDKLTCPVCDMHSSTVLNRVRDGRPCPCGASADVIMEIHTLREGLGNQQLKDKVEELLKDNEKLKKEVAKLMRFRMKIEHAIEMVDEDVEDW